MINFTFTGAGFRFLGFCIFRLAAFVLKKNVNKKTKEYQNINKFEITFDVFFVFLAVFVN